jgi:hypothetical protein
VVKSTVGPAMLAWRPATQSSWATWRPARSAAEAIESACRTPVAEKLVPRGEVGAGLVEGVVGRAVLARPGAGGQRVPADPGVGREPLGEAVAALDPAPLQLTHVRHGPTGREPVDQVGPHPVGREQNRCLLGGRRFLGGGGAHRHRGREQRTEDGDDQSKREETTGAAASGHGAPS